MVSCMLVSPTEYPAWTSRAAGLARTVRPGMQSASRRADSSREHNTGDAYRLVYLSTCRYTYTHTAAAAAAHDDDDVVLSTECTSDMYNVTSHVPSVKHQVTRRVGTLCNKSLNQSINQFNSDLAAREPDSK